MADYKRVVLDTYDSKEADNARRVLVKRWEHPALGKPAKAPRDMKVIAFVPARERTGIQIFLLKKR